MAFELFQEEQKSTFRIQLFKWSGIAIVFLLTTTTIFSFPLDKVLLVVSLLFFVFFFPGVKILTTENLVFYSFIFISCLVSSAINLTLQPIVFLPAFGFLFVFFASKYKNILAYLYIALSLHILIGLVILILSYMIPSLGFHTSLWTKGLPFIHTPLGFMTTVQTFGTICIIWLLLYYYRKSGGVNTTADKILYLLINLTIILTFNRSTYLFYFVVLFFRDRKLLFIYGLGLTAALATFWETISDMLFNLDTLQSRRELLEGFNISFWESNSLRVYLFGRGDNQLAPEVLRQVKWSHRPDIENGYAMLLHTYGFFGLSVFIVSSLVFIAKLLSAKHWFLAGLLFYYLFISSYFTQEFVSITFYLVLLAVIGIKRGNQAWFEKKLENESAYN